MVELPHKIRGYRKEKGEIMKKKLELPAQIFIALIAGIAAGLVCYFTGLADFTATYIKPFGTIFVNLLKFMVVPIVLLWLQEL